jgi:predicted RND superfamily exporter protein
VKTLVDFLNNSVINDAKYGNQLSSDQRRTLAIVTDLMYHSLDGKKYSHSKMFDLLSPLSGDLKSELIDLLYMYHGSLYHYDDAWTLSLEQFVNYLHGTILKDERFDDKIDSEKRETIENANKKITDAKKLLVGKNHSRAILNTNLEAEGEETFAFIEKLKKDINDENAHVFVIGNSPMALEMSKTFNDEMNFITILTMLSIFAVVAVTFKSLFIPTILVLIIQSAVWITMSILSITGSSVYFIALIIVQAILMGATIDYAILYTSYYLEHRKKKLDIKKALIESYNKSVPTIITSASVLVIVTYIVGTFDKQGSAIAAKICITVSEGTLCAAIIILLILPALLASCDKIILRRNTK